MTFFEDLTAYQYLAKHEPVEHYTLNVGWLSGGKPYARGETSQAFRERLFQFCLDENVVMIARGFHVCELCNVSEEQWFMEGQSRYGDKAHWVGIGCGEIRIAGKAVIYAAPTLIYHYVVEHGYKPPDEFVEAVLNSPDPASVEYKALINKYYNVVTE